MPRPALLVVAFLAALAGASWLAQQAVGDWSRFVPLLVLAVPLAKVAEDRIRGAVGADAAAAAIERIAAR